MDRAGATGALVKMEGLIPVAIAHLSTLAALIVPLKSLVSLSLAEAFNVQRRQLVSMVLFHWLLIPKETCLACIQCNE
jgi:hypothetical protein